VVVKKGSQVTVISQKGAWANVSYDGKTGYMKTKYLGSSKPDADVKESVAYAVLDKVIIYADSSLQSRAVKALKYGEPLKVKDEGGDWLKAKSGKATGYVYRNHISASKPGPTHVPALTPVPQPSPAPTPKPSAAPAIKPVEPLNPVSPKKNVKEADWWTSGIQDIFAVDTIATVTDVDTGLSWHVKRVGGANHADVRPVTAEDTAQFKRAYGGEWSWDRRAVWVTVGGSTYAASTNGMPHGGNPNVGNNFPGHHCIHFTNSHTHAGNRLDALHQAAIKRALAAGK